ncbi:MAG: 30S ribosomal protein S15 [Proteobacteria bacterium]|nr:30S ribosomal protein S15 [Pseudomonadota bacterium]
MNATSNNNQAQIKKQILSEFARHPSDSASCEVQVALITHRLKYLNTHFSKHSKDHHSKTGLLKLVSRRRRLLSYLKKHDLHRYQDLISRLGLRK